MRKKLLFLLPVILAIQPVTAQKKIILEKIQCWSVNTATMNYWKNENICRLFGSQLNQLLLKYQHLPLADSLQMPVEDLNKPSVTGKIKQYTGKVDTGDLHLYLGIIENSPANYFSPFYKRSTDSLLIASARTVFQIKALLLKNDNSILIHDSLDIIVRPANTPGMGIPSPIAYVMPRNFIDIFKTGLNLLLNPENDLVQIVVDAPPVFAGDNYILSRSVNHPRVYVSTAKGISSYIYNRSSGIIRMGEPIYEEIKIKGKKAEKYPEEFAIAIKASPNYTHSDFVFLRQEARDVVHDRNYLIKLVTQLDPESPAFNPRSAFTNFLAGRFHYLFNEKDTLAVFSIERSVVDKDNTVYANKISNGFDTASVYSLIAAATNWSVVYDYVVTGRIAKQDFSIRCSSRLGHTIRELYLDNKLVCIAQGRASLEKFVVFDASLSIELYNQLFMIGFNRFFE